MALTYYWGISYATTWSSTPSFTSTFVSMLDIEDTDDKTEEVDKMETGETDGLSKKPSSASGSGDGASSSSIVIFVTTSFI